LNTPKESASNQQESASWGGARAHSGGSRPGSGRPRKALANVNLESSREEQIAGIKAKLASNPPAREYAALSRTLAQLTGDIQTYKKPGSKPQKSELPDPKKLPTWWSDEWARVILVQRINSQRTITDSVQDRALNECEHVWATEENLSIEDFRAEVLRQGIERKQRLYPDGYPKNGEEWRLWDLANPEEVKAMRAGLHGFGIEAPDADFQKTTEAKPISEAEIKSEQQTYRDLLQGVSAPKHADFDNSKDPQPNTDIPVETGLSGDDISGF